MQEQETLVIRPETLDTINNWQESTFGKAEPQRAFNRVCEEFTEFAQEVMVPPDKFSAYKASMEAADVIITLVGFLNACDNLGAVDVKMAINRNRKWRTNNDGTCYHHEKGT